MNFNDWNDEEMDIGQYAVVRKFDSPPKNCLEINLILFEMDSCSQTGCIYYIVTLY